MIQKQTDLHTNMCDLLLANYQLKLEIKHLKKQNHQLRIHHYNRLSANTSSSDSDSSSSEDETDVRRSIPLNKHNVNNNQFDTCTSFPSLSSDNEYSITGSSSRSQKFKPSSKTREPPIKSTSPLTSNKPKLTVLGNSMVRNTGPIISDSYKEADSTVYSISGLSIDKASQMAKNIFSNHSENDVAVLQVGTCDVENENIANLITKYDKLINSVSSSAPSSRIVVTAVPLRVSADSSAINEKTRKLNNHLRSVCSKDKKLTFLDANPPVPVVKYAR